MYGEKRRITIKDVAVEAGVSHVTVSYVLNNNPNQSIPEGTRTKVMEAVRKLDYRPSASARSLRLGKSKIVLVVWPESTIEESASQLFDLLTSAVKSIGFSLVWQMGQSSEYEQLADNLAPAVVVWLGDENDTETISSLERFRTPIVTLSGHNWFMNGPRMQIEYLLKQDPRPIIFADTEKPQLQSMSDIRLNIVRQVCHEHGVPEPRVVTIPQSREKARVAVSDLLEVQSMPFALCAFNDDVAFAALAALYDLHIAVPEAVSVIGHDDTRIAELSNPPLTTIGRESTDLLERLIASVLSVCQGGPVLETGAMQAKVIVRASA